MSVIDMNRARLLLESLPYSLTNSQTMVLESGAVVTLPMVAVAYSHAMLRVDSGQANAKLTITCNGVSVVLTLDDDGNGSLSLTPFIRSAVYGNHTLNNPLLTSGSVCNNGWRGSMVVIITEAGEIPKAVSVSYIFGNYSPRGERVTDLYFDYDPNGETWVNFDNVDNYQGGQPTNFTANWCNINDILEDEPSGDFTITLPTAWYYGNEIWMTGVNYHFRYDCRSERVLKVRWLDTNGNINERKFTKAATQHSASSASVWHIPHDEKAISDGYYFGRDEWRNRQSSDVIVVGDDCIPITHFDWLKTIVSAPVAEVFVDGIWVKCDIADTNIECDHRKQIFSITLNLVMPTDDIQQL